MAYQGQQHHGQATNHVDEYGNPVVVPGGGMGAHGVVGTGTGGHVQPIKGERKARGILHRSGSSSSSSSSSEDDGMGGRRKKGMKDKIKEKLPGGNKDQQHAAATGGAYGQPGYAGTTTGTGVHGTTVPGGAYGQQGHTGMMTGTTAPAAGAYGQPGHTGMTGTGAHGTYGTGEKKGVMDKIKEKLPGGHGDQQHTTATGGAYGQPGYTGAHGTTATGGAYGQPGHTGMTGTGAHGATATGGAYGQPGHTGMTGTGTHGTTATGGTYGQQGHAGMAGTGTHGTGEKKGIMDKIKEKLPGQH